MWITNSSPTLVAGSPGGVHQHAGAVDGDMALGVAQQSEDPPRLSRDGPLPPPCAPPPRPSRVRTCRSRRSWPHCVTGHRPSPWRTSEASSPSSSDRRRSGPAAPRRSRPPWTPGPPGGQHVVDAHRPARRPRRRRRPRPSPPAATWTPPTRTGAPDRPGLVLRGAGEGDGGREHREPVRLEGGDVAHPAVEDQPGQPGGLGRRRQHLAPVATVGHLAHVDHQDASPRRRRHRHVHGQVVARRAADGIGRGGHGGAGPGRSEPAVRRQATRLADGGRTESRQRPPRCPRNSSSCSRRDPPRSAVRMPCIRPPRPHRARAPAVHSAGVPDHMLIVTQVAPYADGPAGVHGVLAQAATGLQRAGRPCRPRPHRGDRRRRHLARPPGGRPRPRPLHHRRDAVVPRAEGRHPRVLATTAPCASSASTPPPTPTTAGPSTAPCSAPASTAIPGPRTSPSTSSTTTTPPPPTSAHAVGTGATRSTSSPTSDPTPASCSASPTDQVDLTVPGGRVPDCGFPLAWSVQDGAARTFYTALGHFPGAWETPGLPAPPGRRPRLADGRAPNLTPMSGSFASRGDGGGRLPVARRHHGGGAQGPATGAGPARRAGALVRHLRVRHPSAPRRLGLHPGRRRRPRMERHASPPSATPSRTGRSASSSWAVPANDAAPAGDAWRASPPSARTATA